MALTEIPIEFLIFFLIIIIVVLLVWVISKSRKERKKKNDLQNLNSKINDYETRIQNLQLRNAEILKEPAVIEEHYKTQIQGFHEKFLMVQEEHQLTLQNIEASETLRLTEQNLVHATEIEKLKEKHAVAQKKSFTLGGNQVIGDISQIAGIFHTMSEYDHFSLITSVSKQASYDAIGMSDEKLDFIEFKTKGARLSGKEGLVKKLIDGGKVRHRIIDVILPPDLQLKDRN